MTPSSISNTQKFIPEPPNDRGQAQNAPLPVRILRDDREIFSLVVPATWRPRDREEVVPQRDPPFGFIKV